MLTTKQPDVTGKSELTKILVVDDEFLIREMLSDVLLASGRYEIVTAENGVDAFEKCRADGGISLVISDLNMPVMDGLSLIRTIRKAGMDTPIVVMSGNSEISVALDALESGASDYLNKNETVQDIIVVAADKALDKKRMIDENRRLLADLTNMNAELENVVDVMTKMGVALADEHTPQRLVDGILTHAMNLTSADTGILWLKDKETLACAGLRITSLKIERIGGQESGLSPLALGGPEPAALVASIGSFVSIPDVHGSRQFWGEWTPKFDAMFGYDSRTMLLLPMVHHGKDVMGVIQLMNSVNSATGEILPFDPKREIIANSLALQSALAIKNAGLYKDMGDLFEGIVETLAAAIDEKSPVTRGHISRVAAITMELAKAVNDTKDWNFKNVSFSDEELNELRIAALMHDVGKITTPDHVIGKATKLEKIVDRVHLIEERYRYYSAAITAEALRKKVSLLEAGAPAVEVLALNDALQAELLEIDKALAVVQQANNPEEFMSDEKMEGLRRVYERKVLVDGSELPMLTEDEFVNLSIRRGSINAEELEIMRNHAVVSIRLLSRLPFFDNLKNVPIYAGTHHERLNGTGYPLNLDESLLPVQSRIIALADLFEALTASDRPYKKRIPLEKVQEIMEESAHRREIDPDLFGLFKEKCLPNVRRKSGGGKKSTKRATDTA